MSVFIHDCAVLVAKCGALLFAATVAAFTLSLFSLLIVPVGAWFVQVLAYLGLAYLLAFSLIICGWIVSAVLE